jgi:hypothetical protein
MLRTRAARESLPRIPVPSPRRTGTLPRDGGRAVKASLRRLRRP